jgi:glyoxylase-like metal-dependent hydrolase (beta-lactamase superfamily II)
MSEGFASRNDLAEKTTSFTQIGEGIYAFTAEGDPNSGVIIGDDSVMVIEAQATPSLARKVIAALREVTDKPISHVVLTHYHAVRVLGASAFQAGTVIMGETARGMVAERGMEDWQSEFERFPRLFRGHEEIPGLTWPTVTFRDRMTVWLGSRRVDLIHMGRAHTAGDIVVHVPDADVVFSGDIIEAHSACYCGDGHFADWPATIAAIRDLKARALVPGRGAALGSAAEVVAACDKTADFIRRTYDPAAKVALKGGSLKDAWDAVRAACDPVFSAYAIYEHCLPFNVARAFDEAQGIDHPKIWTAERDLALWRTLKGD